MRCCGGGADDGEAARGEGEGGRGEVGGGGVVVEGCVGGCEELEVEAGD